MGSGAPDSSLTSCFDITHAVPGLLLWAQSPRSSITFLSPPEPRAGV